MRHTFAICAYGESPYLETCIRSLVSQTVKTPVILCTSTPCAYIDALAGKYGIPVYVNEKHEGIAGDWNFAYEKADCDFVTLAHQDDIYLAEYAEALQKAYAKYPDMSIFMSASRTVKDGNPVPDGKIERVKKLLRLPLRLRAFSGRRAVKLLTLRFGNPVICPSCSYNKKLCGSGIFNGKYSFVLDWDALVRLAERKGRWICSEKPLILYRVHADAATAQSIRSHVRETEESEMFDRLLPGRAAAVVKKAYRKSYEAYTG